MSAYILKSLIFCNFWKSAGTETQKLFIVLTSKSKYKLAQNFPKITCRIFRYKVW